MVNIACKQCLVNISLHACLHYMVMFATIVCMATKHDKTAFVDALAELAEAHPDIAERLGSDPSRAELVDMVADLAPGVAAGSMSRASLVALITAIAPEPEPERLVSFTTRLPEGLAQEVKTLAVSRGVSVQSLVAGLLRAGLAAEEPSE